MKIPKIVHSLILSALAISILPKAVHAQTNFNSGSDGSFGAINLTANQTQTIQLPPDGILHCTTVNIPSNSSLRFTRNATNTPVYILASGDVLISGMIYLDGVANAGRRGGDGGPGGYAGGQGGSNPSNGFGPGGGKGGWNTTSGLPPGRSIRGGGGFGTAGTPTGTAGGLYGNSLLIPLVGGSGGGGGDGSSASTQYGGGGGGGAILIASNSKITFSPGSQGFNVYAVGGGAATGFGGGSGGAVRVVAPTVTGNATFYVGGSEGGGFGRIRVDALTNSVNLAGGDGSGNYATFGANMVVFPTNLPELRVTKAAGTDIAPTQVDPVFVLLPAGAPATQTVTVQAKNFSSVVPLVAVVTPEAGDRTTYNFDIDNTAAGVATGSVQVQIPAGVSTRIDVWTR